MRDTKVVPKNIWPGSEPFFVMPTGDSEDLRFLHGGETSTGRHMPSGNAFMDFEGCGPDKIIGILYGAGVPIFLPKSSGVNLTESFPLSGEGWTKNRAGVRGLQWTGNRQLMTPENRAFRPGLPFNFYFPGPVPYSP